MNGEVKRNCHRFESYEEALAAFNAEERANAVANYMEMIEEYGETIDERRREQFVTGWFQGWLFSIAREVR